MHPAIRILHQRNTQLAIALTGGGSMFVSECLKQGGASQVVIDVQVPYAKEALEEYLGHTVEKFNSAETAQEMAYKAHETIIRLKGLKRGDIVGPYPLGIGVTASLAYEGQREGRINSAFISLHKDGYYLTKQVVFSPHHDRETQEQRLAAEIINCIIVTHIRRSLNDKRILDTDTEEYFQVTDPHRAGLRRNRDVVLSTLQHTKGVQYFVFPGSFNPAHEGHKEIVDITKRLIEKHGIPKDQYLMLGEMTFSHNHKDYVNPKEIIRRADAAEEYLGIPIIITDQRNLEDKTNEFELEEAPETTTITYMVGIDLYYRIMDTPSTVSFLNNCDGRVKLLVFPRNGDYMDHGNPINDEFIHPWYMEAEVVNIESTTSSTEIRERLANG